MKKSIIATLVLSLWVAAMPAHAKGGYIGGQRAAAIAKAKVGGGKIDDIDLEHSRRFGAYYEVDVDNCRGEYEVRVQATTGRVLSVRRTGDSDDCHRPLRRGHRSGHYHDYDDDDHDDD